MRAGKLRHAIRIERMTRTQDDYGAETERWVLLFLAKAEIIMQTTGEFIRDYGSASERTTVFRIWFDRRVTVADRVIHDRRAFDIIEIKEIGNRQGLELRTVFRGLA